MRLFRDVRPFRLGWALSKRRWGWRWVIFEYGRGGRRAAGWRPSIAWAAAAASRAERRMLGGAL